MLCNGIEIKAGQFWEQKDHRRVRVVAVVDQENCEYPVVAIDRDGDITTYQRSGVFFADGRDTSFDLTTYLPDCTGFDWVAQPVQQYRDLAPDELVEEGDEYLSGVCGTYVLTGNWTCRNAKKKQTSFFKYRRPINPPAVRKHPEYWMSPTLTDADGIAYIQRRPDADAKYEAIGTDGTVMFSLSHRSPDWTVLFEDEAKKRLNPVVPLSSDTVIRDCSLHINGVHIGYCTTPETSCPHERLILNADDLDESDDDFKNRPIAVAAEDIEIGDLVVIKNGYAYPVQEDDEDEDDEPVEDEYLYLVDGDVIEAGDEYKMGDTWHRFRFEIGRTAVLGDDSMYRRKITNVFPRWYRTDDSYAYIKREFDGTCCAVTKDGLGGYIGDFDWCFPFHDSLVESGRWIPCTERAAKESIK